MALDTSRRNGRGGMAFTRLGSYGTAKTASAARAAEAARWLADHAAELAEPVIDGPVIAHEPAHADEAIDWVGWADADGRITDDAREEAAWLATRAAADIAEAAIEDRLTDPDLPGWGTTFDPEDVQWGFTTHRSPHTLPGAVSGRPQPAHLAR